MLGYWLQQLPVVSIIRENHEIRVARFFRFLACESPRAVELLLYTKRAVMRADNIVTLVNKYQLINLSS